MMGKECRFQAIHCLDHSVITIRYCKAFNERDHRVKMQSDGPSGYRVTQNNIFLTIILKLRLL